MSKKPKDLSGQKFGRLTVIDVVHHGRRLYYKCVCDCGKTTEVRSDALISGHTQSCGCLLRECGKPLNRKRDFVDGTQISKIQSIPTISNKSGVVGVNWDKSRNQWQASLRFQKHKYNLGRFDSFDEAVEARKAAEEKYFKNYKKEN